MESFEKWRIDEIPQFWNIIKEICLLLVLDQNDLSLIKSYLMTSPNGGTAPWLNYGLTGWAQIRCQYTSDEKSSREKLAHDLYYIKHASFFFDIGILHHSQILKQGKLGNEGIGNGWGGAEVIPFGGGPNLKPGTKWWC